MNKPLNQIQTIGNHLSVSDQITVPMIPGDGIGPEVTVAMQSILQAALRHVYGDSKKIIWKEVLAGEKSYQQTGEWLPVQTLEEFSTYKIGIKGPLTTPVGEGIRSLNVALRKDLDLFVCLRPVRYFPGISAPVKQPEKIDITIFRENTEDVYSGVEFESNSQEAQAFLEWLKIQMPKAYQKIRFHDEVGIGVKPISQAGSHRLVRAAIQYAIKNKKPTVTLVHKGNIMKYTEGAFRKWGYDLAENEFGESTYTTRQFEVVKKVKGIDEANREKEKAVQNGKIWVNDMIADAAFQNLLLYPQSFSVIATPNLNGDYLSDALAAQVGGIGIAPGANINYESGVAIFEATHGTAPDIAGKNLANPSSLILSSVMMLEYLGWDQAAEVITKALEKTIKQGQLTIDLAQFVPAATTLGTKEFAKAVISNF